MKFRLFGRLCLLGFFLSAAIVGRPAFAQSASWQLAYENDALGQRVAGDLGALVSAVRGGADVKVLMISGNPVFGDHSYLAEVTGVTANNTMVYVQARNQSGSIGGDGIPYSYPDSVETNLFRTNGDRQTVLNSTSGPVISVSTVKYRLKWFVRK